MTDRSRFFRNVLIKALILFAAVNGVFAAVDLMPALGRVSIYNTLIPGRVRLPYGEDAQADYNLSLFSLEAMFASHEAAARPEPGPLRVMLIGDSATWGFLLQPQETLASILNRNSGGAVRTYNFGYPTMTVTKDLLMLSHAVQYEPDLIIWLVTLESMPQAKQLDSPILQNNADAVRALIAGYRLHSDPQDPRLKSPTFWNRTMVGGRRALADLIRLQMYGFLWAATGVDQAIPAEYDPPQSDLEADEGFHGLLPPVLLEEDLAFDVLSAGREMAGDIPVWIVNEPVFLSSGLNSAIRYNFFYPRWAYDQYRSMLADWCRRQAVVCHDFWDLVPAEEFSNSAIHRTPRGEAMLADALGALIAEECHGR
ncbi:MAG: hypothetical protein JW748_02735 [Anaerolineales bacterium]|nr:hypothetical protein [Anaerolineales bacterium]